MNRDIMCRVIREYIFDRKGVWVDIAEPDTEAREELFHRAFFCALKWYSEQ